MKKRILALLAAMILLFSACSSDPSPTSGDVTPGEETPGDATPGEETPGDPEIVSEDFHSYSGSDITVLNPLVTFYAPDFQVNSYLMDPLVMINNKGDIEPGLATSWEKSADGLKWTFKIREGVMWLRNDGTEYAEITSQDFIDSMTYLLDPATASLSVDFALQFIEGAADYYSAMGAYNTAVADGDTSAVPPDITTVGVKAVDKYTVEYTQTWDIPYFLSYATFTHLIPISKAFVEEIGGIAEYGTTKENYLGYGAFLFKTWDVGEKWEFTKNEKYYLADRIHINNMSFVMLADYNTIYEMFKRGEIIAAPLVGSIYDMALADPEVEPYIFRTRTLVDSWQYYFNVNSERTPETENLLPAIQNLNFRKAIFAAFNRTAILSVSTKITPEDMRRNSINTRGWIFDDTGKDYMDFGNLSKYEDPSYDSYNPDLAKTLIETAKTELGSSVTWPVTIQLLVQSDDASAVQEANVIKQSIEETLGTDNVVVAFQEFVGLDYFEKQNAGAYDFTRGGWIPDYADPAAFLEIYQASGYIGSMNGIDQLPEYDEFNSMIEEAKYISDKTARYEALAAVEEYMIDNALVLPMQGSGGNFSINKVINPYEGFQLNPIGLCSTSMLDVIVGTTPLTPEEREAQKAAFDASLAD